LDRSSTQHIHREAGEIGVEVVTPQRGDSLERMEGVLGDAIRRSQIIITTGGIGHGGRPHPQAIANITGRP
jgi:molybdopterin-biosynthesis enzyme MoeA-like protein